ncbi:MAG: FkbM family methyltransferase [Candidatus Dojkabacteria bacterium]
MKITNNLGKAFINSLISYPEDLTKVLRHIFSDIKSETTIKKLLSEPEFFNKYVDLLRQDHSILDHEIKSLIDIEGYFMRVMDSIKLSDLDPARLNSLMVLSKYKFNHVSFSQSGEDLIVEYLFKSLGVEYPTYIDIGAYDPYVFSNTALFYMNGSRGVNIDPNPEAIDRFNKERPDDKNLNLGIASAEDELEYYKLDSPSLNTFSKKSATEYEKLGHKILEKQIVKVDTYESIVKNYFDKKAPDFMSLDVEGLDEEILRSIDFKKHAPKVICVETITYSKKGDGVKEKDLIKFIEDQGYRLHADTNLNSIFIRKDI